MTFEKLELVEPLLRAVSEQGYSEPSPIQAKTIPSVLEGADVMASAQTGTGKTAAFVLPLLQQLSGEEVDKRSPPRVLIITPTRELAAQIHASIETYGRYLSLSSAVVFGGVSIVPQIKLLRQGVDILVATPGRLLDLHNQKIVKLSGIKTLVLDEADRMLDMGFIPAIRKIQSLLPVKKQTLLFSATFAPPIRKLAREMLDEPVEVDVAPRNTTVERIGQQLIPVDKKQKTALLTHLIEDQNLSQVLVFSRTKHGANRLVTQLCKKNINAAAIHGNKSQTHRTRALAGFKQGSISILVATDIAARGIDIQELPHVINFDLPNVPEDYVHRIGRTGRAGREGRALSLVSADEHKQLVDIEKFIGATIPRQEIDGFEPDHAVPDSKTVPKGGSGSSRSNNSQRQRSNNNPRRNARSGGDKDGNTITPIDSGRSGNRRRPENSGNRRSRSA